MRILCFLCNLVMDVMPIPAEWAISPEYFTILVGKAQTGVW
jgi:hypothetical protein